MFELNSRSQLDSKVEKMLKRKVRHAKGIGLLEKDPKEFYLVLHGKKHSIGIPMSRTNIANIRMLLEASEKELDKQRKGKPA